MGTIVGVAATGGVVLGGDQRTTDGATVTGRTGRAWSDEDVVAAAIGPAGDVDAFRRSFVSELHRQRAEEDALSLERITRIAADLTREHGVDALVGARDGDGVARLREVGSDGSVLETEATARGSGMQVATGALESASPGSLDDAEDLVREALAAAGERDTETGGEFDVVRLADAG